MLAFAINVYLHELSRQVEIIFDQDLYVVDPTVMNNAKSFKVIDENFQDSLNLISEIYIESYASPEGEKKHNQTLSENRTNATINYLKSKYAISDSMITSHSGGVAWDQLKQIVAVSNLKYRYEVLSIIKNVPEETWRKKNPKDKYSTLVDSRNKHLMDLRGGRTYNYMLEHIYPQLRYSSIVTITYEKREIFEPFDTTLIPQSPELATIEPELVEPEPGTKQERLPLFAVKTNLLYDVLAVPQIEVEVPIGNRISIAGEWIFPWWVAKDNGSALEILSGGIEGKYWFGNREKRPILTGWFAGVYAGGGLYDLQWNNNGYQGEFFIAAGVSGGYAHTINRMGTLRMEYSLGIGFLKTNYRYYEGMQDNKYLVWQYDGVYSWFGPTKAKVTLSWLLHRRREVKQ